MDQDFYDKLTEVDGETSIPLTDDLPERIGRYRIHEKLGEGGMGVVYRASQTEPVRRDVALKVVKLGMDTRQVVARFAAERQALAVMDHPNIAHVFDAGATASGRPYFVMELVKGVPITVYCDELALSLRERLELFIEVCQAIQHAHQKGVIHRDLKPSNILVGRTGATHLPKIIDFGVAKATGQQLTEETLCTVSGQLLGTPEYMSPEQADFSDLDIDTRSDIYSLGVVLYELLTGRHPLGRDVLRREGLRGLHRRLSEQDPPRPSTRLGAGRDDALEIARRRRTDPGSLRRAMHGDLDWIVMKALDKDRARRYETANGLALDIRRYMNHEPIAARPPSSSYRAWKFVRRNRLGVALASLLVVALIAGVIGTGIGLLQARREARKARTITAFVTGMLGEVAPAQAQGREVSVREVLDEAARKAGTAFVDEPELEAEIRAIVGDMYNDLGHLDEAQVHIERSIELYGDVFGPDHPRTFHAFNMLGLNHLNRQRYADAAGVWQWLLPRFQRVHGSESRDSLSMMQNLAASYLGNKDYARAEPLLIRVLATRRRLFGGDDAQVLATMNNLAHYYLDTKRYDEAERLFGEALATRRRTLGPSHPRTLISTYNLGDVYHATGRDTLAEPLFREALEGFRRVKGEDHPHTLVATASLAASLVALGRFADAEPVAEESHRKHHARYGADHPDTGKAVALLAGLYEAWGRPDAARVWRDRAP